MKIRMNPAAIQELESRTLLSAVLEDGTIHVMGTNEDDLVRLLKRADQIIVTLNEERFSFMADAVRRLSVDLLGGNDVFSTHTRAAKSLVIDGGSGNDNISGGVGDDVIRGGTGHDSISGGEGIDSLFGEAGADRINSDTLDILEAVAPIALHPANPRYFIYQDQPTAMVTSGEHYGAVLNMDFDYVPYLNTLAANGLNHTRTFSGTYREVPGSFNITRNVLAPAPNRYLAPWKRSETPGYYDGGNKFDLAQWDDAYFARLKDFVGQAELRGIFVEFTLFCVLYSDALWGANPMNAANNINGVGAVTRSQALSLNNGGLLPYQTAFVDKVVTELNPFSNVMFELCNEPYVAAYAAGDWQRQISSTIRTTESALPNQHLVTQNIGNGAQPKLTSIDPNVDVFQYHYIEPSTIYNNYSIAKPIGNNETGFDGVAIDTYRHQGWETMLSGAALYSNLDYSFAAGGWEDGTYAFPSTTPGSGGAVLRQQLGQLKSFMNSIPFHEMSANNGIIKGGIPNGIAARAFAKTGNAYALYFRGGTQVKPIIDMPAGLYQAEWVNTKTGVIDRTTGFNHAGGNKTLISPTYTSDIALRIQPTSVQDTVPPLAVLDNPLNGASFLRRTAVTFAATASDDVAVDSVEFLVDGAIVGTDMTAPYNWVWQTPNRRGAMTVAARAVDTFGNTAIASATIYVS
jgi:Ca2+-binding RTX toxin-like protein